jgi:hypothetical protein
MQSRTARFAVVIGVVAAAVVLFIVLSSGGDDDGTSAPKAGQTTTSGKESNGTTKPRPQSETITVRDAKPVGGVKRLEYTNGERVRVVVRSDVADEIHVHGYDLKKDVAAGGSARFDFPATIEGVFEIELEGLEEQIAELVVRPS